MNDRNEKLIYNVSSIERLALLKSNPPTLLVSASGLSYSSGWSNPILKPRPYQDSPPPEDGIVELEFVATPPSGINLPYLEPITGHGEVPEMPAWVKGVRVITATNELESHFPSTTQNGLLTNLLQTFDGDDEPVLLETSELGVVAESMLVDAEDYETQARAQGSSCREFQLASVPIPEIKTEWVLKCVLKDPFSGKCIGKTKVPVLYTRTSRMRLFARVCVPDDQTIWDEVSDCLKEAVVAAAVAGLVTKGNLAAAAATLKGILVACLKRKLGELAGDITVSLRREKTTGIWKPV